MALYAFRVVGEDNKPTGYYGMATATNKNELFWTIDQYTDPNMVELKKIKTCSFCFKTQVDTEEEIGELTLVADEPELELSDEFGMDVLNDEENWYTPKW